MSEPIGSIQQTPASKVTRLVASRVYGGPVHQQPDAHAANARRAEAAAAGLVPESGAATAGDALPFYTNPASRVEAATAIALGRAVDVKG